MNASKTSRAVATTPFTAWLAKHAPTNGDPPVALSAEEKELFRGAMSERAAAAKARGDLGAHDRFEIAREFFTNPEFRAAMSDMVAEQLARK